MKRLDGMAKATGAAKYTYDINLKNQLIAKGLGCPHAHCKIKSIDVAPALKVPGVVDARCRCKKSGDEIECQGDLLAVVAAETEGAAREGVAAIKVEYEMLPVFVNDSDLAAAKAAGRTSTGGGKRADRERCPRRDDERRRVRRQGDRAAAQGVGPHGRGRVWHRRHHALLPGAARLDGGVGRRQADGLSFDAERLAAPTRALPTTAGDHGRAMSR